MAVQTQDEAEEFFAPHIDRIATALLSGIYEHDASDSGLRAKQTSRTRSSSINDLIVHHAQVGFGGVGNVRWRRKFGARELVLDNTYCMRFKKLGSGLRPLSEATQLFMDFLGQVQQMLPKTPDPLTNVVAGYVMNKEGVVSSIWIVCPDGRRNKWKIALPMDVIEPASFQAKSIPIAPPQPQPRRIRDKDQPERGGADTAI